MSLRQVSKKHQFNLSKIPKASRPQIPAEYGIPKNRKGILSWSHVTERMTQAMQYWVCTVSASARPHVTPVDGLWLDNVLYFGGSPQTKRNRNLLKNSAVSVHLDGSNDVVIMHGDAQLQTPNHELATQLSKLSAEKYGYGASPEAYQQMGIHVFRPITVFAWKQFPKDATRWQLQESR